MAAKIGFYGKNHNHLKKIIFVKKTNENIFIDNNKIFLFPFYPA